MNRQKEGDAGDGERTQMDQVDQHVHIVQTQSQTKEEQRQKNGKESAQGVVCGAVVVESAVEEQGEDVIGDPHETRAFQKNEEQPSFPRCFGALCNVVERVGFGGGGGGVET